MTPPDSHESPPHPLPSTPSRNPVTRGLVGLVRGYQRNISGLKPAPTCRFTPSCSEYAAQAIERFGPLRGGWLAAWRIARCNPLVPGGVDPVPDHFPRRAASLSSPSDASLSSAPSLKREPHHEQ